MDRSVRLPPRAGNGTSAGYRRSEVRLHRLPLPGVNPARPAEVDQAPQVVVIVAVKRGTRAPVLVPLFTPPLVRPGVRLQDCLHSSLDWVLFLTQAQGRLLIPEIDNGRPVCLDGRLTHGLHDWTPVLVGALA